MSKKPSTNQDINAWVVRLASDNYPIDAVLHRVAVLAQRHGDDFNRTLLRVAELRLTKLAERPPFAACEPLKWAVVSGDVKLGDTFTWLLEQRTAYAIHTDADGVRRARIGARLERDGVQVVDEFETAVRVIR